MSEYQSDSDAPDCLHEHVRTFRSHPRHSKCLDCGAVVVRRWVSVIPPASIADGDA